MTKETITLRRCIGSARYGIEPHEAPAADFPAQPSQKDGLGRMCRTHWNAYTRGLARDAKARKATAEDGTAPIPEVEPIPEAVASAPRKRTRKSLATPEPGAQGDAG